MGAGVVAGGVVTGGVVTGGVVAAGLLVDAPLPVPEPLFPEVLPVGFFAGLVSSGSVSG